MLNIDHMNIALMPKWWWRILKSPDSLVSKIISDKYGPRGYGQENIRTPQTFLDFGKVLWRLRISFYRHYTSISETKRVFVFKGTDKEVNLDLKILSQIYTHWRSTRRH